MIKKLFLSFLFASNFVNAQQIVFTTKNSASDDVFFRVNVNTPLLYDNITELINAKALFSGKNKGPITLSHNGAYYVFQSERFANTTITGGYEAITISNSDFTVFEVPVDAQGNAFHNEGLMQISNDGKTIYFVNGGGKHTRDVFKITKGVSYWSDPVELSTSSSFAYNIAPYLSYDESKLLFEASDDSGFSTDIVEVLATGNSFVNKINLSAIPNSSRVISPCYDMLGNIYFEAQTDGERIWKMTGGTGTPVVVNADSTNDNSPVTLPDGRIVSISLPNSLHQIKVMDADGANATILTESGSSFSEVFDIGISAGGELTMGVQNINVPLEAVSFFPNPCNNVINVDLKQNDSVFIYNSLGVNVFSQKFNAGQQQIQIGFLPSGIYFIRTTNTVLSKLIKK